MHVRTSKACVFEVAPYWGSSPRLGNERHPLLEGPAMQPFERRLHICLLTLMPCNVHVTRGPVFCSLLHLCLHDASCYLAWRVGPQLTQLGLDERNS